MTIHLHVPFGPSVNSLYPGRMKRHKSREYKAWIMEAGIALNGQWNMDTIHFPVCVTYQIGRPDKRRRDLDNMAKALGDLLVSHGVLKDDSLVHKLIMEWVDIKGVDIRIDSLESHGTSQHS